MTLATRPRPFVRVRGHSFMALVLVPELPLAEWMQALDEQIRRSPSFFEGRPVVVDCAGLPRQGTDLVALTGALRQRGIRIIGIEGADASWPGSEDWARPLSGGRPLGVVEVPETPEPAPPPPPEPASLVLDQPVRSGQTVLFPQGDVTIIGSVASGAEVMAGGSIHIYGTLRGRAVAGLSGNPRARIFCRRLEAELLAIDGLYHTADEIEPKLRGHAVQAWLDGETLVVAGLD